MQSLFASISVHRINLSASVYFIAVLMLHFSAARYSRTTTPELHLALLAKKGWKNGLHLPFIRCRGTAAILMGSHLTTNNITCRGSIDRAPVGHAHWADSQCLSISRRSLTIVRENILQLVKLQYSEFYQVSIVGIMIWWNTAESKLKACYWNPTILCLYYKGVHKLFFALIEGIVNKQYGVTYTQLAGFSAHDLIACVDLGPASNLFGIRDAEKMRNELYFNVRGNCIEK